MIIFKELDVILQNNVYLYTIFFTFIGICFGSFFNVVILRYPKIMDNENSLEIKQWFLEKNIPIPDKINDLSRPINFSLPASHCFNCKTPLKWFHNIPIISYLFLRGKCGFCHTSISIQYPLIELFTGIVLGLTFYFSINNGFIYFSTFSIFLLICFLLLLIDFKLMLLPDFLTYSLLWYGIILYLINLNFNHLNLLQALWGCIFGYSLLYVVNFIGKLFKKEDVIGQGDFKLLAALGIFIGFKGVAFTFFFSPFIAIFTLIILKIISKKQSNTLPYGPSLIISALIFLLFHEQIAEFLNISFK